MISFRYHLVTIVAVFLALGLGVLAGTTVLDQGLVNGLQNQTAKLQRDLEDLRGSVSEQRFRIDRLNEFATAARPVLTRGTLLGRKVVVVTQEGVDGATLADATDALEEAGAEVLTILSAQETLAGADPASRAGLAKVLGVPADVPADELSAAAAGELARRLALGAGRSGEDSLVPLLSEGFLVPEGPNLTDASLAEIGGRDQSMVVVGGSRQTSPLSPKGFLEPLTEELVRSGSATAATEGFFTRTQFIEDLREETDVGSGDLQYVTVDNVDQATGGIALPLALQRLLEFEEGGDYGVKVGATALVPPLEPGA